MNIQFVPEINRACMHFLHPFKGKVYTVTFLLNLMISSGCEKTENSTHGNQRKHECS